MKHEGEDYISLQEAAKYCNYSQEYLGLRARQGKLRAIKPNRNWITKREWVKEYMARTEKYNNSLEVLRVKKIHPVKRREAAISPEAKLFNRVKKAKKEIWPPANLPIKEFDERKFIEVQPIPLSVPVLRFSFVTALVFVLLIAGGVLVLPNFVKQNLKGLTINNKPSSLIYVLEETGEAVVEEVRYTTFQIAKPFTFFVEKVKGLAISLVVINSKDIFKEYAYWLSDTVKTGTLTFTDRASEFGRDFVGGVKNVSIKIAKRIVRGVQGITRTIVEEIRYMADAFRQTGRYISLSFKKAYRFVTRPWRISLSQEERITKDQIIPKLGEKEGMVVILSTEDDEEVKEKIKTAFSDEVRVEPKDDSSGIIVPIFRDGEGEEYLYILVPIKDN